MDECIIKTPIDRITNILLVMNYESMMIVTANGYSAKMPIDTTKMFL